jgi:hypothetical protein
LRLPRLKLSLKIPAFFLALALSPSGSAQTLSGTVTNGTTGAPAGGDDVILIRLAQGMEETARTKTDAKGSFKFDGKDAGGPHLVRVIHQSVTYHHMAPPGTSSVDIQVFDAAKKVQGISATADLLYVQAKPDELGVTRIFAVDNASKPPRTQLNDRNFEFDIPVGAKIDGAQAQTAGGQWVDSEPVAQAEKGRYAFVFPLRPGQTDFQITYRMPYNGSAKIDPKPLYPLQHLVVILPQSIGFSAAEPGVYDNKQPPNQPGAMAEVASNTRPGEALSFTVSGTGILADDNSGNENSGPDGARADQGAEGETAAPPGARDNRPGGGLGPPSEAPDPLKQYRWQILLGFGLLLAVGAMYIALRSRTSAAAGRDPASGLESSPLRNPVAMDRSGLLLQALKEELFQLEVEHKQGVLSQQEYEKAKAALDQTLERALKRPEARVTG